MQPLTNIYFRIKILPFAVVLHFVKVRCSVITLVFSSVIHWCNKVQPTAPCGLSTVTCIKVHQKHRSTIWPARGGVLLYCEMHCVGDWHECAAPVIGDWGNGRGRIPLIRRCCKIRFWIMWQIWYLLRWSSLWSEDAAKISILRFLLWLSFVICQGRQRYGANDILLISRFGKIWSALWSLRFDPHYQHSHNFL